MPPLRTIMVRYWLMKSEPHVYPFSQLVEDGSTHWDGVRNYQARNMMRDDLKLGDMVLFYHSNTKPLMWPESHVYAVKGIQTTPPGTLKANTMMRNHHQITQGGLWLT